MREPSPHCRLTRFRRPAMALLRKKATMPKVEEALPGRSTPLRVPEKHFVNGHRIVSPFPVGLNEAVFGMGCFWGAERLFWEIPGVYSTAVGYAGGFTPNPTRSEERRVGKECRSRW